ncbi:MAG: carboxypeptidase-like regulatory domain-containing protein [Silvibacterium sp.]
MKDRIQPCKELVGITQSLMMHRLLSLLFLVVFSCALATAQQQLGSVNGTVTDSTGAVIPAATVTLKKVDTGVVSKTVASRFGAFTFLNIIPGKYTVSVDAPGFQQFVQTGLNIETGVSASVFAKLVPGSTRQSVTVSADAVTLDTSSPNIGTTLEPELLAAAPVEVEGGPRSIYDLSFSAAPGVARNSYPTIGAGQLGAAYFYYNGIPTNGQVATVPPYDFVSEARIDRTTFDAQWGWSDGDVRYQTRSGTNSFHGNAFYFNRNSFFDSKGFGNPTTPQDHENNYGFSVGGPVLIPKVYDGHNRTFFYFSFDEFHQNSTPTGYATVPTQAMKTGDFSGLLTADANGNIVQAPIFDPQSPDPMNPQQFQYLGRSNVIDPARFSATSASLLQYIPAPNSPGTGPGNLNQNYYYKTSIPYSQTLWGLSIDERLTSAQTINYSMFISHQMYPYAYNVPIFGSLSSSNPLNTLINAKYPQNEETVNYAYAIRSNLALTAGLGYIGTDNVSTSSAPVTTISAQNLTASPVSGFPGIGFGGIASPVPFGEGGFYNANYAIHYLSFYNNWLWTKGRHSINIGGQGLAMTYGNGGCTGCVGSFNFSGNTTTNNISGDPSSFVPNPYAGSPFASYLLGQVDTASNSYTPPQARVWSQYAPYIQDNIKVTPKLTVNAGLRWDIQVPYHVNNNEQDFVTPASLAVPNPAASGQPGVLTRYGTCSACAGITRASIHWKELGPRIGMTYAINPKTVISTGYSIVWIAFNTFSNDGNSFGTYNVFNSTGTNVAGFGNWDVNKLNFPPPPDFSSTSLTGESVGFFDPKKAGMNPYMENWTLSLQRELPGDLYFRGDYIGELAIHQMRYQSDQLNNIPEGSPQKYQGLLGQPANSPAAQAAGIQVPFANFMDLMGGNATVMQALTPYPQYTAIYNNFPYDGTNNYHALQMELDKRYTNGLFFLAAATFQHEIGSSQSEYGDVNPSQINPYNPKAESVAEGSTYFTSFTGAYDLPIGRGKKFFNKNNFAGKAVGGWQVAWEANYAGGLPYGINADGSPYGYGNRANRVAGVPIKTHSWSAVKAYIKGGLSGPFPTIIENNGAFTDPGQYTTGNSAAAYSSLRGPASLNENLTASKSFAVGRNVNAIVRVDYFNAFNRWNVGNCVDNNITDGTFGQVTGLCGGGQRQGQAEFRITF